MKKTFTIISLILMLFLLNACGNNNHNNEIQVYTRDTSSGTREAFFNTINFKEAVKDDSLLTNNVLIVDGNGDMINKIKNDINGIGYISLSSYKEREIGRASCRERV